MAGNLARLPSNSQSSSGGGLPPSDLYKVAVEEYRFQAQYNWSRTQYLLAFNAGILAVAIGLNGQPLLLGTLAFGFGAVTSVLTMFAVSVQHTYYRAARDRMRRIEDEVGVDPTQKIDTTATLGARKRRVSVNQVVYLLLGALAAANIYGFVARLVAR